MSFLKFKNTNMWLNSSCFNISLILFSMARWAACHDGRSLKGSFLPFPSFDSKTIYKSICWRTHSFYSQSPSDSNITVPTMLLSFWPHQEFPNSSFLCSTIERLQLNGCSIKKKHARMLLVENSGWNNSKAKSKWVNI